MDRAIRWWRAGIERRRIRGALEELAGRHRLRRRATWVERSWYLVAAAACLLSVLAAVPTVGALEAASGHDDPRITAVTTTAAVGAVDWPTGFAYWYAPVAWTDLHGAVHKGTLPVAADAPAGTRVPARLSSAGTVLGPPLNIVDLWTMIAVVCAGIGLAVLVVLVGAQLILRRRADRLRHAAWGAGWAEWQPSIPDREGL